MTDVQEERAAPKFMDSFFLKLWLWAFIQDAETFLQRSNEYLSILPPLASAPPEERMIVIEKRRIGVLHFELAKYHFTSTMGSLLRFLKHNHALFPEIKEAYEKATHLQKEGKNLRDMMEHADQYHAGKGRRQSEFVREADGVGPDFPGGQPGTVDATSVITDEKGHWLGGRLNVEQSLAEVREIMAAAEKHFAEAQI